MDFTPQVIIAGGGPVGAVAALRLAQKGIKTLLLEAQGTPREDMRASTFHPPTLDMMEDLGLLDALLADGLKAPIYQYRNRRSGNIIELDMTELGDVVRHPYRLQCEQYKLARLATQKLMESPNGHVLFNHQLLNFEQDGDQVTVYAEGPLEIHRFCADYLIGADGSNSTVRKSIKVGFDGFTYDERFLTLSTAYPLEDHFENLAKVNYISDADEWSVLLRVPTLWRILVPVHESESDALILGDAKKDKVLRGLVGKDGIETYHRTIYRVHQRVAETFRKGRVLLIGDAAHLNNPLGGFGMNSGIHDAWNLCSKLELIYSEGGDPDALLDRFDRQRQAIAREFVQKQTINNKVAMEAGNENIPSPVEEKLMRLVDNRDGRRAYMLEQAMVKSLLRESDIE